MMIASVRFMAQHNAPLRRVIAVNPIGTILDAFQSHAVVALGKDHGNEQSHAFRLGYDSLKAVHSDLTSWPVPSLAMVAGTGLTRTEFDYFDRALYLGPPSSMTTSRLPQSLCADAAYLNIRRERIALSGLPDASAEQLLARDCPITAPR